MAEAAPRVFISYAHDDAEHEAQVMRLWLFLIENGIDARLDVEADVEPQNWARWMLHELRAADFALVVASPEYKRRAEWDGKPGEGWGVQWEAPLIAQEVADDPTAALRKFLPVLLPGRTATEIPAWLGSTTNTRFEVTEFSVAGAERLLRYLLGRPAVIRPPLGAQPELPIGSATVPGTPTETPASPGPAPDEPATGLRTRVDVRVELENGVLTTSTAVAGHQLGTVNRTYPAELVNIWQARTLGATTAAERYEAAGDAMAGLLFTPETQTALAGLVDRLVPGNRVEFVLHAADEALTLPWELLRLAVKGGAASGPVCLRAGVTMRRQLVGAPLTRPTVLPGPLKVLAAVAAPDETEAAGAPLDVEQQMQMVLDATTGLTGARAGAGRGTTRPRGQVQILEVASQDQISDALHTDPYHVLHLFAHGSPTSVELSDEDGRPEPTRVKDLVDALRRGDRPVPLIMLVACWGAAGHGAEAMAAGLVMRGADRVIAFQASVTEVYATQLAKDLYTQLLADPTQPIADALAAARHTTESHFAKERARNNRPSSGSEHGRSPINLPPPEWGLATLLCAGDDPAILDDASEPQPLSAPVTVPAGGSVRDLKLGQLIGRRPQLREATAALRRHPDTVAQHGVLGGVTLIGVGGIGKTALAGRVITRLRDDGWTIALHEGRWNPTALLHAVADALDPPAIDRDMATPPHDLHDDKRTRLAAILRNPRHEDSARLGLLPRIIAEHRLLIVFDDFEQNLTTGGTDFLDPALAKLVPALAEAVTHAADPATAGGLLVACRHPLPDDTGRDLHSVQLPTLTRSELRRLFHRLAKLDDLDPDGQHLIEQTVGGHPRLIEFVDALLRAGRSSLVHVQDKLRALASQTGVPLQRPTTLTVALTNALTLGAADILLDDLLALLTPGQADALQQACVCRCPLAPTDLAHALSGTPRANIPPALRTDLARLTDLTLLLPGPEVAVLPWTAELIARHTPPAPQRHERAEAVHLHRFQHGHGTYDDLLDLPRHVAALGRYDDVATLTVEVVDQLLTGTASRLAYLTEITPLIPTSHPAWVRVAKQEFEMSRASGDLGRARTAAETALTRVRDRLTDRPHDERAQADLSVVLVDLGDLAIATGRLADARTYFHEALTDAMAAADRYPASDWWHNRPALCHSKLGDVAVAAGDLAAARTAYQAGLDIAVRLAAADPTNTGWQRDLSVSHERLGDVAVAAGDLAAARTAYQAGLDIGVRLAAADPTNTGWQREAQAMEERLAEVERQQQSRENG
jgi:tetratricopeptide (TPR) repeat protein